MELELSRICVGSVGGVDCLGDWNVMLWPDWSGAVITGWPVAGSTTILWPGNGGGDRVASGGGRGGKDAVLFAAELMLSTLCAEAFGSSSELEALRLGLVGEEEEPELDVDLEAGVVVFLLWDLAEALVFCFFGTWVPAELSVLSAAGVCGRLLVSA